MKLERMSLDELFVALRAAAIAEYESKDGAPQHAATEAEGRIVREIAKRDGREEYYRKMLDDEHPRVRYRGALGIRRTDPTAAMRVLRENTTIRTQAGLGVIALQAVISLEKLGVT